MNKKIVVVLLVFILISGFLYFKTDKSEKTPVIPSEQTSQAKVDETSSKIKTITKQEDTEDIKFEIKYPELLTPSSSEINQNVKKILDDELISFNKQITPVKSEAGLGVQNSFYFDYELGSLTNDIYSVVLNSQHYYNGAAHPLHNIITYNYDLKNKKELVITDLLDSPKSLDKLANISKTKLIEGFNAKDQYYESLNDTVNSGASPDIKNYQHFLIKKDGIEVLFDEYQVASYAEGRPTVFISFDEMKDFFSQNYKNLLNN
jgi:hypothetical protein